MRGPADRRTGVLKAGEAVRPGPGLGRPRSAEGLLSRWEALSQHDPPSRNRQPYKELTPKARWPREAPRQRAPRRLPPPS